MNIKPGTEAFERLNSRRHELIDKKHSKRGLTPTERDEFVALQNCVSVATMHLTPRISRHLIGGRREMVRLLRRFARKDKRIRLSMLSTLKRDVRRGLIKL